jgi:hypothetical protein
MRGGGSSTGDMGAAEGDLGDEGRDGEFARVVNSDEFHYFGDGGGDEGSCSSRPYK